MVKKLLILTFNYYPDLCAGSFRTSALVNSLHKKYPELEITIITTIPNRYSSFSPDAPKYEQNNKITIHRIQLPKHQNGMIDQSKAFLTYYRNVHKIISDTETDIIFATSSKLFTAFLGARIAKKLKKPLYLDIRDIFVDTITDIFPKPLAKILGVIFSLVERYSILKADTVNLVSGGFIPYFKNKYPSKKYQYFTNGIDNHFLLPSNFSCKDETHTESLTILYAGNIGEGQGLHNIIPQLAKTLKSKVLFKVIGDGGRRLQLEAAIEKDNLDNVTVAKPIPRNELINEYLMADILFLHLNSYDAFKKVLPSKLFEYSALGKPILAGVSGFAADFIKQEITNAEVFEPGNVKKAIAAMNNLEIKNISRQEFIDKYDRSVIMDEMAAQIISDTSVY